MAENGVERAMARLRAEARVCRLSRADRERMMRDARRTLLEGLARGEDLRLVVFHLETDRAGWARLSIGFAGVDPAAVPPGVLVH